MTSCEEFLQSSAFEAAYLELIRYARTRTRDGREADEVVSDTVLSWMEDLRRGKEIGNVTGYLRRVFERRLSDYLRRKYRDRVEFSDDGSVLEQIPDGDDTDGWRAAVREAEAVREALGRLSAIYREVVYRHYMKGQGVEEIARALGVPVGTVKSRLSDGRGQMKETISVRLWEDASSRSITEKAMEKNVDIRPYSDVSFAPKRVTVGIWGNGSRKNEPWCYLKSLVAQNILVLAYEKPISIRDLSAALAIPTPYVEHEVEALVNGELLGKTAGGLVYTRMFLQTEAESYGDIPAQEALAAEIAPILWQTLEEGLARLWADEASATRRFTPKQTATFRLMLVLKAMSKLLYTSRISLRTDDVEPPPRPNCGKWLAMGCIYDYGQALYAHKYATSGPVQVNHVRYPQAEGEVTTRMAAMWDFQSLFGAAHWAYNDMTPTFDLQDVVRFYASFMTEAVRPVDPRIYELTSEFEKLHILRRDENGEAKLDVPALPFAEWDRWNAALDGLIPVLKEKMAPSIRTLIDRTVNRVPAHVDGREAFLHEGATRCLTLVTMMALVESGAIPDVVLGETPVILVVYRPESGEGEP